MSELPGDLDEQIRCLLDEGDELLDEDRIDEAMSHYRAAWELLPEPRIDRPLALDVLAAMGTPTSPVGTSLRAGTPS